jgi:VCBS repeat-containing protein
MTHSDALFPGVRRGRLGRLALITFALLAAALPAAAVTHHVDVLLDLDNTVATGCTVATADGPFDGVEQILRSVVETESVPTPSATVVEVLRFECVGGAVFGPPVVVDPGDWPVGVGLGVSGADVIETYFPAGALPPGTDTVRLGVTLTAVGSGEEAALLFVSEGSQQPIIFRFLSVTEIPTLSEWGMILLVGLLALAAAHRLRRRGMVATLVVLLALGGAGLVWAATTLDGDPSDWSPGSQLAGTPPAACTGLRIAALFAKTESGQLCLRIDACLIFNTAPVAHDDAFTTDEDTPLVGNVLVDNGSGADEDADGDPLTVDTTPISGPANGTLALAANGDFTYTPNADFNGIDSFEYQIDDGNGGTDVGLVTITVNAVNDAPVVDAAAFSVPEDAAVGTVVGTVTFSDPDTGQTHTFAITAGNTGGAFAIGATSGEITVAAALDFETLAAYSLTVEVTDDGAPALSGSNTVEITVTDVDDAPVAVDDAATVTEDDPATTIDVLANDTDTDGGPISIDSVTQPANGTVAITNAGADLTYEPDADYCNDPPGTSLDTFSYTLAPGGSTATVTVTVTCEDDDPVAVDDAATVAEDAAATTIDVLANDTDVDGGPISIQSVTQPANGTVVITNAGADLTYEPDADYCNDGSPLDTFTYTLTPGGSTATVSVTVTCVDDPPVAVDDAATVAEDSGANTIDVLANDTDVDAGPKAVQSVTQPANGTVAITNSGADLTYAPNANYCNDPPGTTLDTFTYTLNGGSAATVTVTVTCVDDPPVAVDDAATVGEDSGANTIDVLANDTDLDGGPISIQSVTQPANGTVAITNSGADLTYAPNADYCNDGSPLDTFTYTLNGGSTATVSVTVTCVDDAPVLDLDADDDKGTAGTGFAVAYTENDGPRLLQDADEPGGATITDVDSPTLVSLTVTLTNLLDAGEELLDADVSAFPDLAKDYDTTTTPGEGVLTISSLTPQPIADWVAVLRTVTYAHTGDDPDTTARVVEFVANDGTSDSNTAVSTVTITAVDDAPVAVDDAATVNEDSGVNAIDVLANDTDVDGGTIEVQSVTQPANGTVAITGGGTGVSYTPDADYCNDPPGTTLDTFTYTLNGGSTATVSVTVTCVDDDPTAVDDAATVVEDSGANAIDVLANDTDPDGGLLEVQSVTQPANGSVGITGGGTGVSYTPNADYCNDPPGTTLDTFTYTLNGGSTATVSVTVTCVDDDPVAVDDAATVVEDSGANAIDVLANDTDVDGGPISVTSVTQPANGTVAITGGGTGVSYAPNADYCNDGSPLDTFTYTLTPGGSTATVSVTVTCVDDPPVAVDDAATVIEDSGANAIDVLANDTDIDGGPISVTSVTQPANGTVAITGGGTGLTYTPNLNYCNDGSPLDTFTYTLAPGGSTATVSVTVTCVNDPPVAGADAFDFIGNTPLSVDSGALASPHVAATTTSTFGVLDNDSDPVENDAVSVTSITVGACTDNVGPTFDCTDPTIGTVSMQPNGRFTFTPAAGDTAASRSFTYVVTDDGTPAPASATGTVTLNRFERVWYVDPAAAGGGTGTAGSPFNTLDPLDDAGGVGDVDLTGDYIFVHQGTLALSAPMEMEASQHLVGAGHGLSIPVALNGNASPTVLVAAGTRPQLTNATGDAVRVTHAIPVEIVGLSLRSNSGNAIDLTSAAPLAGSGTLTIANNQFRGASAEGIDVNLNASTTGTLALTIANNTWDLAGTHTGNAVDVNRAAGTLHLAFNNNTGIVSTGTAVLINGGAVASTTITGFANNSVHQNTGGAGVVISNATFDAVPGGAFQQVDGDNLAIGVTGDPVGGAGMSLTAVQGNLFFDDLDVYGGTTGLTIGGTGGGMTFAVAPASPDGIGTSVIRASNGAALDVSNATIDLRLDDLDSVTAGAGVSLSSVGGTFTTDTDASISKTSGGGTAFSVASSVSGTTVTYRGTLNVTSGGGVSLTNNTGSTMSFSGGMTLSTGANAGFVATGGGTVTVTDPPGVANNTITTTTGTALNVSNTTIGAGGLTFERISAGTSGTPTNGIVLNNTGTLGGLTVTGTGAAGSGGTIQNATGDGISLTTTRNVNLSRMNVTGNKGSGVFGSAVTNLTLSNLSVLNNTDGLVEAGIKLNNLFGTSSISNTEVAGSTEDNISVRNDSTAGVLTSLTISGAGCVVRDNSTGSGNVGINIQAAGDADMNGVVIDGCTLHGNRTVAIRGDAADTSSLEITIRNNVITAGAPNQGNQGIEVGAATSAQVDFFDIDNNRVGTNGVTSSPLMNTGINVSAGGTSACAMSGHVRNNQVVNAGAAMSGFGIRVFQSSACEIEANVTNNTVSNVGLDYGLLVESGGSAGATGRVDAAVTNNTVSVLSGALDAIRAQARNGSVMCARITGNTTTHPNDAGCDAGSTFCGLVIRQANTAVFNLEGSGASCPAGNQTAAQAEICVESQNSEDTGKAFAATNFVGVASNFCNNIP